ncbi:hypothetical protein PRIPAC_91783, partial [Pristionchus pacificus]|uniref:Uncharacterized protein n=1 Tax=Pristionchus pacificus TaxID=54126 RepID=A0A2A6BBI0_PRIPA
LSSSLSVQSSVLVYSIMRVLLTLFLLIAFCSAATKKVTFDNKFKKIVSTYLGANTATATKLVNDALVNQSTFEQITDSECPHGECPIGSTYLHSAKSTKNLLKLIAYYCTLAHTLLLRIDQYSSPVLMANALSLVPASKYISALSMLTTFESCVKKTGGDMTEGMALLGTAFKKVLNAPYTKIINKMKTMKKNKKPVANMQNQAYVLATSAMTKALVQKIINQSKAVVTADQYACALGPLNAIMLTNLYQMDYTKTG